MGLTPWACALKGVIIVEISAGTCCYYYARGITFGGGNVFGSGTEDRVYPNGSPYVRLLGSTALGTKFAGLSVLGGFWLI